MVSALELSVLATAWDPVAPVLEQSPLGTGDKGLAVRPGLLNCWSIPVAMLCRTFLPCLLSRVSGTPVTHTAIICWLLLLWWMDCKTDGALWALSVALPPVAPILLLHLESPEFSVRRKRHCCHAVKISSRMSDLNVFCREHCRNWTGGSFFTHCFKPLSSWQAAPQSPVFALAQGHAANVSLAFTLAPWLRHMTPHHYPAPQYHCAHTEQLLQGFGFRWWFPVPEVLVLLVFFSILLKKATQISAIRN